MYNLEIFGKIYGNWLNPSYIKTKIIFEEFVKIVTISKWLKIELVIWKNFDLDKKLYKK